jgi:hypothetical protein
MRFDDVLGDRQPEARILSERLMRPVRIEALEDLLPHFLGHAGSVVVDDDLDLAAQSPARDAHRAARRRERAGIVDQIVDHLAEPGVVSQHHESAAPPAFEIQGDADAVVVPLVGHTDDRGEELGDVDRLRLMPLHLGVEPARAGNVGDQPVEPLDVVLDDGE